MAKISVCLAAYNGEKYIKQQISSILFQIQKDDELVISDNGSTDNTINIINSFSDKRIKLIHFRYDKLLANTYENRLVRIYLNFRNAILHCQNPYILLSDQDDIWLDNKYEVVINEFLNNDAQLVIHDAIMFFDGQDIDTKTIFKMNIVPNSSFLRTIMFNPYLGCCMAFTKELALLAFNSSKYVIPHDTWIASIACLLKSNAISVIDKPLIKYRMHKDNASYTIKSKNSIFFKIKYRGKLIFACILLIIKLKSNFVSNKSMKYQICSNCIMDTTDIKISFDENGLCEYCNNYAENILPQWRNENKNEEKWLKMIEHIKKEGRNREHDCLIGLSGGVDSSYVTWLAKEKFGLRPILFHVDAGWNSKEAVNNIQRLVDGLGLELYTEVINWEEMKDLQLAFFKAQVPHIDTPQDHAFFGALYNFAAKHDYKYILTGANYSTECVREPLEWHYHASDLRQIKDIHRKFGTRPLRTFPLADIFTYKIYYRYVKGVRVVKPLNHVRYIKEEAMQLLVDKFGWQRYPYKHYESRFTRFYEGFWLPNKFGYNKHRAHFSSLILTGQMSREEALAKITQPAYDQETIMQDFEYIAKKLDLTVNELQNLMNGENKTYRDYKNNMLLINMGTQFLRWTGIQKSIIR